MIKGKHKAITLTLTAHEAKCLQDHINKLPVIEVPMNHVKPLRSVYLALKEARGGN